MEKKRKIVQAVCMVVFLVCAIYLTSYFYKQHQANKVYDSLKISADASADISSDRQESADAPYVSPVDFDALWEINPDVIAYITVPGTDVDYPVLQSADDDEYYLEHTIEGVEGLPGSIYTESWQSKSFDDPVTIVYGHNMKNGTMFASLHKFEDETFFNENNNITIYLPQNIYNYEIYATVVYDNSYIPSAFSLSQDNEIQAFIDSLDTEDSRNHFNESAKPEAGDKLIVLSTCIGNSDYRYLVVGVNRGEAFTE